MSKFHINKNGVPAPCKATKGKCPLGGADGNENHFDSIEAAQEYADSTNEKQHSLLPKMYALTEAHLASKRVEEQASDNKLAKSPPKEILDVEDEDEEKVIYYIHDDGTHSRQENKDDKEVRKFEDWGEAMKAKNEVNERRFSELNGLDTPENLAEMSYQEQQDYYLSKPEISNGTKRGPHTSYKDKVEDHISVYLGFKSEHRRNFKNAYNSMAFNSGEGEHGNQALILGEPRRAKGPFGVKFGPKVAQEGIVIKKTLVKDEEKDKDKKSFQLPSVYEIHYLDRKGIRAHKRKFRKLNDKISWTTGLTNRVFSFYDGKR